MVERIGNIHPGEILKEEFLERNCLRGQVRHKYLSNEDAL